MKKYAFFFIAILFIGCSTKTDYSKLSEQQCWQERAENVEIIRDDFGVPHIYGKTDADAVFGLLYAQCEDDFNRVERNYIWAIGRLAEDFGSWQTPWGEFNRYQRNNGDIYQLFDDAKPSTR